MRSHFRFFIFLLLLTLASSAVPQSAAHQPTSRPKYSWKEFAYRDFGFAITFPYAPKEQRLKSATIYSVYLRDDVFVHVRADNGETTCSGWDEWVKEGKFKPESPLIQPDKVVFTSKAVMINGHIAIVGEFPRNSIHAVDYQRQQCLNDRHYTLEARWPDGHSRPKDVDRILDSFRVFAKETK